MSIQELKHEDGWNFNGFKIEHEEDEFGNVRERSPILPGTYLYYNIIQCLSELYMSYHLIL